MRSKRGIVGIAAACALAVPGIAQASTGCDAINNGILNHSSTFSAGTLTSTTAVDTLSNTDSLQFARANTTYTDTALNLDQFAPNNATAYSFDAGDQLSYTATLTGKTGGTTSTLRVYLRNAINGANTTNAFGGTTPSSTLTNDGSNSRTFSLAANTTAIGFRINSFDSNGAPGGTVDITASCISAVSAPTLNSFTYGSVVGYNPGGAAATNIDVAAGGAASGPPTSYTVSNASGGTFAATSATSGGGTVTINNAGVASYTPRIGYRGTDTFFARGTNSSGNSSPATVTISVANPTITASLTGTGATVGSALSGYSVTPAGGNPPYSCALNSGSPALPGGVTLNANCTLTGTPTTPGTYSFNVDITDSSVTGANGGTSAPYTQSNVAVTNFVITQAAPTVTGLAPALGGTAGGTSVVITGTNFYNVTGVSFGGTAAAGFTRNSATQITATSPSGSGTVNVIVTTVAAASVAAAGNQFVYSNPPATPVVTVPANGATTGSTTPTYSGSSDANVTITVLVDGVSIGTTTATGGGTWSKVQPTALAAGSHTVRAFATNGQSQSSADSATNTFTVTPAPVANNYTLPVTVPYNAGANTQTSFSIAAQTSNSPTSYAVGSATTTGGGSVSVNNSGVVTYIAAVGFRGSDTFTYTASNAGGTSNVATVTVPVGNPTLSGTLAGSGTRGTPLSGVQITPAGGTQPYSCGTTLASGALPAGTQLNADCSITGTPAASGSFNFTATITDSSTPAFTQATGTLTLIVSAPTLTLAPAAGALPSATVGTAYSRTFTASGGTAPFTFTSTGTLPTGLNLSAGGVLSGTPTTTGTFNFTVTATDSSSAGSGGPYSVANSYSVTVAPAAPVAGTVNATVAYNSANNSITPTLSGGPATSVAIATQATNGTATASGTTISYTPNAGYIGADSFTYTATGPGGTSSPATVNITINPPPAPTAANVSGVTVAYGSPGTAIDLTASISGVHSSVTVTTAPAHGTTSVAGDVVTYIPTAGYSGADSFGYTATGSGGTSNAATVSLTVSTPAAPTVANRNEAVTYNTAAAIDLSSSISGVHNSATVVSAPTHGAVSVAGDVVTYTPATGYFGADSFTYTATGPGGTSNLGTVNLAIANPPAPVAANRTGVTVAYNSAGTAIDLSGSVSGVHSSIAVASGPAHGTTTVSGDVVTYVPTAGYYGADSFTYTATGPGGTSAPATISLTVATPTAPVASEVTGVAVPYGSAGTAIDLSASISGVHSSIAVATAPAHGTTSINGDVVTYTPAAGYYGADSFTYTATGPGGTSASATVSLTVATPAAPVSSNMTGVTVPYGSAGTAIDLSASISGVHSSIAVATAAAHGITSINGDVVTYTPAAGYYGADSFSYTATGPGGTSTPGTVSLTVQTPAAPTAANITGVAVPYESAGIAIDVSGSISGVYTSVSVASAPAHGTVSVSGNVVTYTPAAGYHGADSFTYTATGPGGTSAPATISLAVQTPAPPVAANITGLSVPYNGAGTSIDVTSSVSGVYNSVAVSSGPAHGNVSVSGNVITYTPTAGYYGADSFTYTATGPGGTSAPGIVSVDVETPAAPTAANVSNVAVPYESTGTAIDLTSSITGVHTSTSIAINPAHGTVMVAGDVVTYMPTAGYFGTDSFTYTATGPGGTSTPATVTLQVEVPPAPAAANVSNVAVPFNSNGTAIDLTSSITGVHTSTSIAINPAHGTVTISGDVVTYIPTAGYYGTDSFTYTATGPGGTSTPATVTLQVAVPPVPTVTDRENVAIPYNNAGTAIDLASDIAGVYTGITVATAPAHGTVTVVGTVATYVPTTDYYGADSFTYTATGPGGTSSAATVRLVVAPPPPPQAGNGAGSVAGSTATTGAKSVDIDLSALVTGMFDRIEIQTQPAHGTVTLRGNPATARAAFAALAAQAATGPRVIATYTAAMGYVGTDSFTFVAVGPGGTSAPATVSVTVIGQLPVALLKTAQIGDGQTVSVMLTDGAREGPFTAATIVSVTPADQVSATIVASGSGASQAYRLDVKPAARFGGTVVVTYTLSNAYGTSAPATVTVTVTARPDPTSDPNVRAISDAQAEATRRFARAQVSNFMRRTEQLHGSGSGSGGAQSNVTLNSRDGRGIVQSTPAFDSSALDITERMRPSAEDPALGRLANSREGLRWNRADQLGSTMAITEMTAAERNAARKAVGVAGEVQPLAQDDEEGGDGARRTGSIGIWSGGAIDIGTQDETTDRSKITATSAGLSGGADVKLGEGVTVGVGGGYGTDLSRIDGGAARVRSDSTMVAAYASLVPLENAFIDGMFGLGDLRFRTRRVVPGTDATALGSRDGNFRVGALALGIDRQGNGFNWSLYGRGEVLDATLGSYVESGADRFDLRFDERKLTSVTGTLGARFEFKQKYVFGTVMPRVRAEWNHEFADADAQRLDYADIPGSALYGIETQGWSREQFQLSLGTRFLLPSLWSFDFETVFRGAASQRSGSLRAQVTKEF